MTDEISLQLLGSPTHAGFTVEEVTRLIDHEVIHKDHQHYLPNTPVEVVGIVCGVLTMNNEIEMLVKFMKSMAQLSKSEFETNYLMPTLDEQ